MNFNLDEIQNKFLTPKTFMIWTFTVVSLALIAKMTFDSTIGYELTVTQWVSFIAANLCVAVLSAPPGIAIIIINFKMLSYYSNKKRGR